MTPSAISLAESAQRSAVVLVLRRSPELTLADLANWTEDSPYSAVLGSLSVAELANSGLEPVEPVRPRDPHLPKARSGEALEVTIMRAFRSQPGRRLASGTLVRTYGLKRWTIQRVLKDLVQSGQLQRAGKTSSTRYWVADDC
ncbi:hypothetical protein PPSIR1_38074 [Plesiocystis pacifica SIR-1]|uniref:Uncharacterized protein n=1 Tax=Plesiocystis pacifica SIR-1 TaxID=391625 RepID=A6G9Q4_9BACT|nr:hypothetical protein PPSIR1_38074 [Plesiocystis pacifica SIR-1]